MALRFGGFAPNDAIVTEVGYFLFFFSFLFFFFFFSLSLSLFLPNDIDIASSEGNPRLKLCSICK